MDFNSIVMKVPFCSSFFVGAFKGDGQDNNFMVCLGVVVVVVVV